ncbi:pectinesterase family protein [Streptomyces sp. NBC_00576]|uniref:pectinesterase family protein n=1 Tax=Streptomyces sp. NBC_00576 TaxID=2903665 RepID=UPI002E82488B|nr:pectinesterase family protein [Streptomyces sp. NBC_00576]WUB72928.1 pectinesterase family protein [Streptomyces sp. NBC_00576]
MSNNAGAASLGHVSPNPDPWHTESPGEQRMPLTDTKALPDQGVPQPPSPPRRRRAGEFTVVSIVTTIVLSIFATLLGPLGMVQNVSAADGDHTTPVFRLDGSTATRAGYRRFLDQFRANVAYHGTSPDGTPVDGRVQGTDLTVEHLNPANSTFTEVTIITEDSHEVRLRFRVSDMYLVGWFDRDGRYNYLGPRDEAQVPAEFQLDPRLLVGTPSYGDLEGLGNVTRDTLKYGRVETENHAMSLWNSDGTEAGRRRAAAAVVYFAQFVSEATRLRDIGDWIEERAFGEEDWESYDMHTTIDSHLVAQENVWGTLSAHFAAAQGNEAGLDPAETPMRVWTRNSRGDIVEQTLRWAYQFASVLYVANTFHGYSKPRRQLTQDRTFIVAPDGSGDYRTIQAAINAVPADGVAHTIVIDKGIYREAITVPSDKTHLTIKGATGVTHEVYIYNNRAHGTLRPDGTKYGTEGSATATFKANDLTVQDVEIVNQFNAKDHPEIGPFETQAVAVAAKGDRQVFDHVDIIGRQDTLLVKGNAPTDQARQYFHDCYIEGTVDFIFGNATAVIDRSILKVYDWPGGTIVAPNTDRRKKYGILITGSQVGSSGVPNDSYYLGRPWHNSPDAWPQAVIRDTDLDYMIKETQPWVDMMPDYHWQQARFREYHNIGKGAGIGSNAPKLTDAEAADYTAQKYLAGTDGWNPVR